MPLGADPHDFAPRRARPRRWSEADLLVVNGAGFEEGLARADRQRRAAAHPSSRSPTTSSCWTSGEEHATTTRTSGPIPPGWPTVDRGLRRRGPPELDGVDADVVQSQAAAYVEARRPRRRDRGRAGRRPRRPPGARDQPRGVRVLRRPLRLRGRRRGHPVVDHQRRARRRPTSKRWPTLIRRAGRAGDLRRDDASQPSSPRRWPTRSAEHRGRRAVHREPGRGRHRVPRRTSP